MTQVQFRWQRRPSQASAETLRQVVVSTIAKAHPQDAEVHVLLTGDAEIRDLNRQYRDIDAATDVLSFPDGDELPSGRTLLGQIVISIDTARRQAAAAGLSELRELQELTLHGCLHLLGHDHQEDDGEMNATELRLRKELLG